MPKWRHKMHVMFNEKKKKKKKKKIFGDSRTVPFFLMVEKLEGPLGQMVR